MIRIIKLARPVNRLRTGFTIPCLSPAAAGAYGRAETDLTG